jgi:hypothetical protein
VREGFEIIALLTKASLIPTLLPGGEGLFQIIPDSSGRRPESSEHNKLRSRQNQNVAPLAWEYIHQLDSGLRRNDDLMDYLA